MVRTSNEFRVTFANGNETLAVVRTLAEAAAANETDENPITQITRTRTGLSVILEDPVVNVEFRTEAAPAAAVDAGCRATPTEYTVQAGTDVIFQAIEAEGYVFSGWYRNGALVASTAIARLSVTPSAGPGPVVYEARFTAVA